MSDLHNIQKVKSGTDINNDFELSKVNKPEAVYAKSDVIVAHASESVQNDNLQKRVQSVRFADNALDNRSLNDNQAIENKRTVKVPVNGHVHLYTEPSVRTESIKNFCCWGGSFPMDDCKICADEDPEFCSYFLRTVFMILFFMLMATAAFLVFVIATPEVAKALYKNFAITFSVTIIAILSINYFMLSFVAENFFCASYFVLFFVVTANSLLLGALTARFETEAFLYATLTTAAIVFTLFGVTWCPCFCFSQWIIVLPVALAVAMLSGFFIHMILSSFYVKSYPTRHLLLIGILILIHAFVVSFEISRLLCGDCFDPYCMDYGLGAYLLYTMFLQICFYWMFMTFDCLRCHNYDYDY